MNHIKQLKVIAAYQEQNMKDLKYLEQRMVACSSNGEKLQIIVEGEEKPKTVFAGATGEDRVSFGNDDRAKAKVRKIIEKYPNFSAVIKYHLGGKWQEVGTMIRKGDKILTKWRM